jgi:hypothetical protein
LVYYRFGGCQRDGTKYYFTSGWIVPYLQELKSEVDIRGHEEKELGKAATKSFQSVLLQSL